MMDEIETLRQQVRELEAALELANQRKEEYNRRGQQVVQANRLARLMYATLERDAVLLIAVRSLTRIFAVECYSLLILNPEIDGKRVIADYRPAPDNRVRSSKQRVEDNHPSLQRLLALTQMEIVTDLAGEPLTASWSQARQEGMQTALLVPLMSGTGILGCLRLGTTGNAERFSTWECQLAQSVAGQIATALDSMQSLARARQVDRLALFNDISQAVNLSYNIDNALSQMTRRLARFLGVSDAVVLLWAQGGQLTCTATGRYVQQGPRDSIHYQLPPSSKLAELQHLFQKEVMMVYENVEHNRRVPPILRQLLKRWGWQSLVAVGALDGAELTGTLMLGTQNGGHTFAPEDIAVARASTAYIFPALYRHRLAEYERAIATADSQREYEETPQSVKRLELLYKITQAVNSSLDWNQVLDTTAQVLKKLFQVEAGSLLLWNEETNEMTFEMTLNEPPAGLTSFKLKMGQGIAGWVMQSGRPERVNDVQSDPRFYSEIDEKAGFQTRSILCAPIVKKTRTIGVLELINKVDGDFTEEEQTLLSAIAASISTALDNARLYRSLEEMLEQQSRMQEHLVEAERKIAEGQFALSIGSEISDPLQLIQGSLSLALERGGRGSPLERYLSLSIQETERIASIVEWMNIYSEVVPEDRREEVEYEIPE